MPRPPTANHLSPAALTDDGNVEITARDMREKTPPVARAVVPARNTAMFCATCLKEINHAGSPPRAP